MIKKFTLYLGLNDKETKMQKIATVEAFKIVTTLRIELLFAEAQDVRAFVETLKEIFNQESVAVQEEDIKSDLW